MILLVALGLSFAVALLRGGRIGRLLTLPLRGPGWAIVAFALQTLVIYLPVKSPVLWWLCAALLVVSYLLLLAFLWTNRRLPGMALIGLGMLCNLAVILANGGYMPISPEAVERIGHSGRLVEGAGGLRVAFSKDIVLPREQTRLWFLGDLFLLPPPFPLPSAFSPGDVGVALGAFVLVQYALCGGRTEAIPSSAAYPVSTKEDSSDVPTRTGTPRGYCIGRLYVPRTAAERRPPGSHRGL